MRRLIRFPAAVALLTLVLAPLALLGGREASAAPPAVTYDYLIGTGILCDLPFPDPCPTIAMASNGDTVEIKGAGTLATHPKSVTGGGTFTHNFAGGGSVSGTWTATKLLSFQNYGCDPTLAPPALLCGGRANIRVRLDVPGLAEADGVLQVDCTIGKVPAGAVEGVRLAVSAIELDAGGMLPGINFNKEVSGLTVYID